MTRYVDLKHGCNYGNNYYFYQEYGEWKDFKYILSFQPYRFERFSMLHLDIRTPIQQMIFNFVRRPIPNSDEYGMFYMGKRHTFTEIKPWFKNWLNKNCEGEWGMAPENLDHASETPSIFFEKRKDLLKLYRFCDSQLTMKKGKEYD